MAASFRYFSRCFFGVLPKYSRRLQIENGGDVQENAHNCRFCSTDVSKPWQLMSGICIERDPVISQPPTDIEEDYKEMCDSIEFESSVLSEHEIQVIKDRERLRKRKEGELDEEDDDDLDILTALDLEDLATEKLNEFEPAPQETEADIKNDTRSTDRKLSDKLILLVQKKIGADMVWRLPQGQWKNGETMRETAERVLSSCSEENQLKVKFLGNAPVGFYKYKYPSEVQEKLGAHGAKIFFFKAKLLQGDYRNRSDTGITDYQWLARDELDSYLQRGYSETVKKFILPVSW